MEKGNLAATPTSHPPCRANNLNERPRSRTSTLSIRVASHPPGDRSGQTREVEEGNAIKAWTLEWDQGRGRAAQDALPRKPNRLPLLPRAGTAVAAQKAPNGTLPSWRAPERAGAGARGFMRTTACRIDGGHRHAGTRPYPNISKRGESLRQRPKKVPLLMNDVRNGKRTRTQPDGMRQEPEAFGGSAQAGDAEAGLPLLSLPAKPSAAGADSAKAPVQLWRNRAWRWYSDDAAISAVSAKTTSRQPNEVAATPRVQEPDGLVRGTGDARDERQCGRQAAKETC